ncbi:MAG: GMC family oxidoreductase [Leptolyngbyaceae bacterium]|nr:GMC family oxidoreductase [Leptolyngbyaceae bacterium]
MIIDDQHYDLIIVGTGAGGGTLAQKLAPTGKKILILERGDFMPLDVQNPATTEIFKRERYHAPEQWYDQDGEPFSPQMNYAIGGNTKIYGAVLHRWREKDFEQVQHQKGVSPEWPIKYGDLEPYYSEAEQLYKVHGAVTGDPTEPAHSQEYPYGAIAPDPQIAEITEAIAQQDLHPSPLPLGLTRQEDDPTNDSEVSGINPAMAHDNVTVKTKATVTALHTNASGLEIKALEAEVEGQSYLFFADIVVLACGAVNSAALLLRSPNDQHPNGLANSSGLVGRNLMKSLLTAIVQLRTKSNSGNFPKTVCVNDFYWGDGDFNFPMGHIQNTGGLLTDVIFAEAPPTLSLAAKFMPGFGLKQLATRSIGWWAQTEDLPDTHNRVRISGKKLYVDYDANNAEAHDRLVYRWMDALKVVEKNVDGFQPVKVHPRSEIPIQVMANQCGTCRFGPDPATSVLDVNCRSHDIHNLYVVDGSFFPSNASVSPALTIMANALRVGEHLVGVMG